jgi:hypothetical protein
MGANSIVTLFESSGGYTLETQIVAVSTRSAFKSNNLIFNTFVAVWWKRSFLPWVALTPPQFDSLAVV